MDGIGTERSIIRVGDRHDDRFVGFIESVFDDRDRDIRRQVPGRDSGLSRGQRIIDPAPGRCPAGHGIIDRDIYAQDFGKDELQVGGGRVLIAARSCRAELDRLAQSRQRPCKDHPEKDKDRDNSRWFDLFNRKSHGDNGCRSRRRREKEPASPIREMPSFP